MSNVIVGQESARKEISRIFDIFNASEGFLRPHFILTGESGSGKSYIIKSLAKSKGFNFLEINTAQITKEGTSGNSLSKALAPIVNYKNKLTIVFCDEFDKLFLSDNTNDSMANAATIGVQNEFLKLLESDTTQVFGDYGHYNTADISKTLFVFAGAFNNTEEINLDKLRDFGIKTEFLGRVGLVYNLQKLTLDDLYFILENSDILTAYLDLFPEVDRMTALTDIKEAIKENYDMNDLGARMVNTLIHQYFVKDGKLKKKEAERITFQKKLSFED